MAHIHKDEIIRWAKCPNGTEIWHRHKGDKKWLKTDEPNWYPTKIYIVDDEFAELRKAYADGKTIQQHNPQTQEWVDIQNPFFIYGTSCYRIKPETKKVKLYQWLCKDENGKYYIETTENLEFPKNAIIPLETMIEVEV